MSSIVILLSYYWIIIFSIVGYGILFNNFFLKSKEIDMGFIGVYGIFILILISYITSFFLQHSEIFNSILLLIGLVSFFINKNIIKENIAKLKYYTYDKPVILNTLYFGFPQSRERVIIMCKRKDLGNLPKLPLFP